MYVYERPDHVSRHCMSLTCISCLTISICPECWPESFAFSPNGDWLAVGTSLGDVNIYSTVEHKSPRRHLNVDNDPFNAVAVTFVEWKTFPWLANSAAHNARLSDAGVVVGFEDGYIRVVEHDVAPKPFVAQSDHFSRRRKQVSLI